MMKKRLSQLNHEKNRREYAKKLLALLSAVTVFVTTYALILPAITIDRETAATEPGLDAVQTAGDDKLVLPESVPGDVTDAVSRCATCAGLTVGAELTDGSFGDGVAMELTAVTDEDILTAAADAAQGAFRQAEKVRAVEIAFKDEAGEAAAPDTPLNLTFSGEAISGATDPVIVRVDDTGSAEKVDGKALDKLVYLPNQTGAVYAVVETKEISTRYISADGSDYTVTVAYGKQAGIPETATLRVSEYARDSKEYGQCLSSAYKKVSGDRYISDARFFDISIINDGKEIEPKSDVSVKIAYSDPLELKKDSELMAYHFTNGAAEINRDVKTAETADGGSEVTFQQGSFSTTGTVITDMSQLTNGSSYLIVAERNGKYYAASSTNSSSCPAEEIALTFDGDAAVISNTTVVPNSCLWQYNVVTNGVTLRNKGTNRYLIMQPGWWGSVTMTDTSAATMTVSDAGSNRFRVSRRDAANYYMYYNGSTFHRTNNANESTTKLYFIECKNEAEYKIRFHYVDGDGNVLQQPVERYMTYSETAVDLHTSPYVEEIEGYDFRVSRYGNAVGDRFQYIQNDAASSGQIIVNLKTDTMYANNQSYQPVTVNYSNMTCITNLVDQIDLTDRPDHMIDVYMVYAPEGAPRPNEAVDQHSSTLPQDEFPFGAPDHNKRLVPNYTDGAWDGTYTLYLDVTGKAASVQEKTKVDVLLIYDTSNSMRDKDELLNQDRYQIAYDMVEDLAAELFAYNKPGEEPSVRIGLVSYASTARIRFSYLDNINDFNTSFSFASQESSYKLGQNGQFGGTNWEDALQTARALYDSDHREDADQYIIFISDGEPTCRISRGDWYDHRDAGEYRMTNNNTVATYYTDTTTNKQYYEYGLPTIDEKYYYTGVEHAYTHAKDDARYFVDAGANLYTVGLFNEEESLWHMNTLANFAYTGFAYKEVKNKNYRYAKNAAVMEDVFADLVQQITKNFGYGNVDIKDVMTATALTTGELAGNATDFKYYKNPAGSPLTEWTNAPTATYNRTTKTVDWDLASTGMLEENTTYTIGFTVWPDQDAYDEIMVLNDMIDAGLTAAEVDAYAAEHYPEIFPLLRKDTSGHYIVQSNANAELTYERFIVENDGEPQSLGVEKAGYSYPNMETTKYYMSVAKYWNDDLQNTNRFQSVVFEVFEDYDDTPGAENTPYATITLDASDADPNDPHRWVEQIDVSPGIVKTAINGSTPINPGHVYRVFEVGYTDKNGTFHDVHDPNDYTDYRYEFEQEAVTPMLYDGEMVFLNDADGDGQLTGTNNLRGGINLYKVVLGRDGNPIYTDDEYEFIVHLNPPDRFIIGQEGGQPVYDPNAYPLWYTMYTDVNRDGDFFGAGDTNSTTNGLPDLDDGWGTLSDGDHVKIKANQMIRIINVPIDTVYSFEEVNVPKGWAFDHAVIEVDGETVVTQTGANAQGKNLVSFTVLPDVAHENTFYNRMTHYEVKLHKVDSNNQAVALPGAVFEIYSAPGQNPANRITINGKTQFTTDENGDLSFGVDLPNGTYYLYEVNAPPGYQRLTEPITVTVADSGVTYSQPENNNGASQTAPLTPGENAPVYVMTAVNEPRNALQIIKIDADHPEVTLPDAVFNLYMLPEGVSEESVTDPRTGIPDRDRLHLVTFASEQADLTTDANGVILFEGGLPPGVYFLFETAAPDGYAASSYPVKIAIDENGVVRYTQRDYNAGQTMTATLVAVGDDGTPTLTVYVADPVGYELPHTGGIGTQLYTTGGIALVCIAILTLGINLKRRRCERRNE